MNVIIGYLRDYFRSVNRYALLFITLLAAVLIVINYSIGLENRIKLLPSWWLRYSGFFLLFAFVFSAAWLLQAFFSGSNLFRKQFFYILLLAAPLIFAGKITLDWLSWLIAERFTYPWNRYWGITLSWPLKGMLVFVLVTLIWRWGAYTWPVAGTSFRNFQPGPYIILLLLMIPLLALAATQPDFLETYPKVQSLAFLDGQVQNAWPWKLLFEISYGLDFITIELFFRGFLVLAFARYAGKDAILPIAVFYCSIHFGKPLFECITSYAGGIILGVVVYNTRTIWGGLMVHLGIAWLMEVAGYVGNAL